MIERRGRPKSQTINPEELPKIYQLEFLDKEGVKSIWKYDLDITKNGPIEVEQIYPKGYETPEELREKQNNKLPLTQREYLNPKNGKLVSYQRFKQLIKEGIIDP